MLYMKKNQNGEGSFFEDFSSFFTNGFSRLNNLKTDIVEEETQFIMFVEVPGIEKKNISIVVEDDYLNITILPCEKEDTKQYIRKERKMESTSRKFYMGSIDENGIKAKVTNGILKITVPKKQEEEIARKYIAIE